MEFPSECRSYEPLPDPLKSDGEELFSFQHRTDDRMISRTVLAWKDYGVVAPTLVTSNGNPYLVASALVGEYVWGKRIDGNALWFFPKWLEALLASATKETSDKVARELGYLLFRAYKQRYPDKNKWWLECSLDCEGIRCSQDDLCDRKVPPRYAQV